LETIISSSYAKQVFDESIKPFSFRKVKSGELVWFINFRSDRSKQLTKLLADHSKALGYGFLTMNDYGIDWVVEGLVKNQPFSVFKSQPVKGTFAQKIASMGKTQLHIAETEKYSHVTYFFNGGTSERQKGEDWHLIPSNKVEKHSDAPEMKAREITDYIIDNASRYDYVVVNYANPDMVGHCGEIYKGIEAMEFLDKQLVRLLELVDQGHNLIITADHGNIEFVGDYIKSGQELTDTEHNSNPVPLILVTKDKQDIFKYLGSERFEGEEELPMLENGWPQNFDKELKRRPLWTAGALAIQDFSQDV
jgi:2,3-bisphosphoglycerate-independent phosphoglycerate mutase